MRLKRHWPCLFLLVVLAACQPAPPTEATPTAAAPIKTPRVEPTADSGTRLEVAPEALKGVKIQVWHPWFGVEANLFDGQVRDFNQANEWGIAVESTSQLNYGNLYEVTRTSLPTPNRPDLVVGLPEHALAWDTDGYVTDLDPYANDPQYGMNLSDFAPVFLTQDARGGKRLGMPAQRSARFLLYDAEWARELGFLSPPRTPEEFREQSCRAHQTMLIDTVKTNDGMGGWLVDTDAMTALSWMAAFGGGVLDGKGYRFLTPDNIKAFTFIKQLFDDGCAWAARSGPEPASAFADRHALFVTAGLEELSSFSRALAAAGNADEWTVLAFPGDVQSGLVIYGSTYIVLNSTPEQQLASWLFVRWLVSPENQKKWVETTGLFPLQTSTLDLLNDYRGSHPQWAEAVALLPHGRIQPQLASWRKVRVMIGDGFDTMFRVNTPAGRVAEILAIMESTARDLAK